MHMIYTSNNLTLPSHPLYCDNKGLVERINKIAGYPTIFPNSTMELEWDCLSQILCSLQTLEQAAPTIHHVKGHQDVETPREQLLLEAQLNCDVDAEAEAYLLKKKKSKDYLLSNPSISHQEAPMFPAGECTLRLRKGIVTRDLKMELAEAQILPSLREKISDDASWWDQTTLNTIDWVAHGQALGRREKQQPTYVKYVHQILPLGKRTHIYDSKYPSNCPTCTAPVEDMGHFWQCQHQSQIQWR